MDRSRGNKKVSFIKKKVSIIKKMQIKFAYVNKKAVSLHQKCLQRYKIILIRTNKIKNL